MARYPLNLPADLKQEAEQVAERQGVSLNQFFLWAVAEKIGSLKNNLDDPRFPHVTYRRGASGQPTPVMRGTNIRVQTVVVAQRKWAMPPAQFAEDYGVPETHVEDALAFYQAHRAEVEAMIQAERDLAAAHA